MFLLIFLRYLYSLSFNFSYTKLISLLSLLECLHFLSSSDNRRKYRWIGRRCSLLLSSLPILIASIEEKKLASFFHYNFVYNSFIYNAIVHMFAYDMHCRSTELKRLKMLKYPLKGAWNKWRTRMSKVNSFIFPSPPSTKYVRSILLPTQLIAGFNKI